MRSPKVAFVSTERKGQRRQLRDIMMLVVEHVLTDIRLTKMIEDAGDIGALLHQCRPRRHLFVMDADIERVAILCEELHALDERWLKAIVGGFILDIATYALDRWTQFPQRIKIWACLRAILDGRHRDDTLQVLILFG